MFRASCFLSSLLPMHAQLKFSPTHICNAYRECIHVAKKTSYTKTRASLVLVSQARPTSAKKKREGSGELRTQAKES